ncbi:MAG TPA: alanine racemase [Gammaproteobacteria bacterium]
MAYPHPFRPGPSGPIAIEAAKAPATGILVVDLDALARNFRRMRDAAAPAECAAVVKADAYGLGLAPVAARLALEGCRRFFVATIDEGRELRRLLPDAVIYVLEGAPRGAAAALHAARLTPVLNSLDQVTCWAEAGGGPAVLHVDTGINRLGLAEAEVRWLADEPARLAGIDVEYVMTHLACADAPAHALNDAQLVAFERLRRMLPPAPTSIGASAGIFLDARHRGDLVRAGIGLYGGNPFSNRACPVEPVVTLRARIVQLRDVASVGTVGYGATHAVRPPCRLAVCAVGYADGYPRAVGNRCDASFEGIRVPVVGRVSMDLTCVDVSAVPADAIRPGDYIDLIGGAVTLDDVAAAADTIGYEILTRLGSRLERRYIGEF